MTTGIQPGKWYVDSMGRLVGPMRQDGALFRDPSGQEYTASGARVPESYFDGEHLVREAAESGHGTLTLQHGKSYVDCGGRVTGPLSHDTNTGLFYADDGSGVWHANGRAAGDGSSEEPWLVSEAPAPQQKNEPGWKMDAGKARIDLIAPEMLYGTANVLAFGAAKYSERNWEKGMSWGRCFGAMMRHLWSWWAGERNDAESGLPHLAHAACCLMFLMAYESRQIGKDDRRLDDDVS